MPGNEFVNYLSTVKMCPSRRRIQDTDLLPSCLTCGNKTKRSF